MKKAAYHGGCFDLPAVEAWLEEQARRDWRAVPGRFGRGLRFTPGGPGGPFPPGAQRRLLGRAMAQAKGPLRGAGLGVCRAAGRLLQDLLPAALTAAAGFQSR